MTYNIILNGFSQYLEKQLSEIKGFVDKFCCDMEHGKTIFVCNHHSNLNELASIAFTSEVVFLQMSFYNPETVLNYICDSLNQNDIYLHGYDNFAHEIAVRLSARKKSSSVVDIIGMDFNGTDLFVKKMIYSNHMEATFKLKKAPYFLTISKGLFDNTITMDYTDKNIRVIECEIENKPFDYTIEKEHKNDGLSDAKLVIVAGRGTKNKENVSKLECITSNMNGKLGVSRPVAMNAWASMDKLVGVSGALVKPNICITAGVSGAAALYAGIEKSDFIVSINTDCKAPIIKKSDVAVIDDYNNVMEELEICMNKEKEG